MNSPPPPLTPAQRERYSRQIVLPEVGLAGQERLQRAAVLLVGAGGLGSPVGLYLAAAGVGRLGVVDGDRLERSNLGRQVGHRTEAVGESKAESLRRGMLALNPEVRVEAVDGWLDEENGPALIQSCDGVVDGCDNFDTRYLVNALCHRLGRPLVSGAVSGWEGQVTVIRSGVEPGAPCYRCLFPHRPGAGQAPSCAVAGVSGPMAGVVGAWQANEMIKLLAGIGSGLGGALLLINGLDGECARLAVRRDPACPVCGPSPPL
ncbi:MAG: ThiF family adenylyltransferase [Magnetococcales bacterium]|nr:ThiF family adenylyltransferase [Magnetococcales bacterium]